MTIIRLVTARAFLRHRHTTMAIRAANVSMPSEKGKAGLPGMIEFLCSPVSGGVAVAALLALAPFMDVVRRVTTLTFVGRSFVTVSRMAGDARSLGVPVGQGKGRCVVIEVGTLPGPGIVAGGAVRPQGAAMSVLLDMTPVAR